MAPVSSNFVSAFHFKVDRPNHLLSFGVDDFDPRRCFLKQEYTPHAVRADGLDLWIFRWKLGTMMT